MIILEQYRARIVETDSEGFIYSQPSQGEIDIRYELSDGGHINLARVSTMAQADDVIRAVFKMARNNNGYVDMNEVLEQLGY